MAGLATAAASLFRRWKWVFIGLLAASLLIMIVEVSISEYTPPLDDVWEVLAVVAAGTVEIWLTFTLMFVLPIVLIVEVARWWIRRRETGVSGTDS